MNRDKLFTEKARAVSAFVSRVGSSREAFDYAVDLLMQKKKNSVRSQTVLAAPGLPVDDLALLENLCRSQKITLIKNNLRGNLQGIDLGCTYADYGIAETGTLVINSTSEDLRLATMIAEIHLAILPVSRIRQNDRELTAELGSFLADPNNFTAFITGASRTADIERVLAIGVHGPLELHTLLLEDTPC